MPRRRRAELHPLRHRPQALSIIRSPPELPAALDRNDSNLKREFQRMWTDEEMGYIVAKIEPGMHRWAADQLKTTDGVEDKYRFIRYIEKLENIIIHPGSQR
jgi:hypothetical protein